MLTLSLCLVLSQAGAKDGGAAPAPADAGAAAAAAKAAATWEAMQTPESVFYDADTDTYLVSNINGSPVAKDNNGYLSELSPDGKVVTDKLVEGGKKVTLNAPKGLTVADGVIYVTDLDTVRMFDRKTGAPKGEVKVPGATFLNDISAADGKVYFTDSGLKGGKEGLESNGTDGVYVIDTKAKKLAAKTLVKSKDLHGPNGILATKDTLYVACFGAAELLTLGLDGKKKAEPTKLPKGALDGVVLLGEELLISSWEGKALFRGKPGGEFKQVAGDLNAPADIGYDTKRNRVLVPRFLDNKVEAWDLK
jgi:hypothetical protein